MKYLRSAFTMIELIFVIVILGILSAVAIPKLNATRVDAVVSKIAQNIMSSTSEIAAYAVSNAKTEDNLSLMSNGIANMEAVGDAIISSKKAVIKVGSDSECITIEIKTIDGGDSLNISFDNTATDELCITLQSTIDANKYPMKLRGVSIVY